MNTFVCQGLIFCEKEESGLSTEVWVFITRKAKYIDFEEQHRYPEAAAAALL
jgi:hypothetical protein